MAYTLRYYKELTHDDGTVIRLEIHKKGSSAEAIEIGGVVQELSLQIQGQQGDVDTPIVKTSLSMTFVDARDIDDGRKNGFWEEFYSPDAVLWKVILMARKAEETSFRTIWGGYVTPDSYSENLVYRGSINIIARDNIGHMQDFPFDATGDENGLISLYDLVSTAWAKIESPMVLDWRGAEDEAIWMECNGTVAYNTLMNVSAFEGMNWYEAVEKALHSYCVVMRYIGNNRVQLSTLRYMPYLGHADIESIPTVAPVFISGATRELLPAIKKIEETVSYDLETSALMPWIERSDFLETEGTYRCKIEGVDMGYGKFGTAEHEAPICPIENAKGWANVESSTLFFNPYNYGIGYFSERRDLTEEILRYMYIAANNVDDRVVWFSRQIVCADIAIRIRFGLPISLNANYLIEQQESFNLKKITYAVHIEQNGITEYLGKDGAWKVGYQELTYDYDDTVASFEFEQFVPMGEHVGNATITLSIIKIEYSQTSYASKAKYGLYACIQALSFDSSESASLLENNTVNTLYDERNNVVLNRTPEIGPAYNVVAIPQYIKNGIFVYTDGVVMPARRWNWYNDQQTQQMAVFNHLQLLSFHGYPSNLISGTIVNADITNPDCLYIWKGKNHILQSGSYNFLNGRIDNAVIREIEFYQDFWHIPESMPEPEEGSEAQVGNTSKSSPTYNNTTTVTVGEGTGITSIIYEWWEYDSKKNQALGANLGVELNNRLTQIETAGWGESIEDIYTYIGNDQEKIEDITNRLIVLEDKYEMFRWVLDEDGNILGIETDYDLYSFGTLASGGRANQGTADGSGGIMGVIVNGEVYTDDDNDRLVVLPDYPTTVAELADAGDYIRRDEIGDIIGGGGDYSELSARLGVVEDDILSLAGRMDDAEAGLSAHGERLNVAEADIVDLKGGMTQIDLDIASLKAEDAALRAIIETLGAVAEMFVWDDEEHTRIRTDFDLFSKGTISSGGKATPSGEE